MKPVPDMTPQEMGDAIRRLKRMIRRIGALHVPQVNTDFVRASGLAICPRCGLEYFDHPAVADQTLVLDCEGRLLHL